MRGARVGAAVVVAALGVVGGAGTAVAKPSASPPPTPSPSSSAEALAQVRPLAEQLYQQYQQGEAATQQYDGLVEQLTAAKARDAGLQQQIGRLQAKVAEGRQVAGTLAAAQYRNQDVSQFGEFLLSKDPYQAADFAQLLQQAARSQALFLAGLHADERALAGDKAQADADLAKVQALTAQAAKQKAATEKQLAATEQLVAGLTGAQKALIDELEQQQANAAQLALLASGALGAGGALAAGGSVNPSKAGGTALSYAFAQLGKPYLWGGNGPGAYDCSGLTQQSWLSAGVAIPRTSQEQWALLRHVALNQLRPGDLIVYFPGATHVAMYIGRGLVIQAPHPGAYIEVTQIAANPILGAVRPDPGARPLKSFTMPRAAARSAG